MKEMNPSEKLISLSQVWSRDPIPTANTIPTFPLKPRGGSALPTWLKSHYLNGMMGNAAIWFQIGDAESRVMT